MIWDLNKKSQLNVVVQLGFKLLDFDSFFFSLNLS